MEKYQFDQTLMQTMEDSHIPFAVYQFIDKRVVTLVLSAGFRKLFEFDKKEDAYYVMDNDMYRATQRTRTTRRGLPMRHSALLRKAGVTRWCTAQRPETMAIIW